MRVQTGEGELAVDVVGSGTGRLVVCAHGMGDNRSSWRHVVPGLVEAGFRVATVDLRGHGDSDTTFAHSGPDDVARDLITVVRTLGGPAVLIGNSAAAAAAVRAAADAPDNVCGLVLVGPVVRGHTPGVLWALSSALFLPAWGAWVWGKYYRSLFKAGTPPDHDAHVAAVVAALRDPARRRATRDVGLLASKEACAARADDVRAPVLALVGTRDPDVKPVEEAAWLREHLSAEVQLLDGVGHYPQMEVPDLTTREIVRFLKSVEHTACHAA